MDGISFNSVSTLCQATWLMSWEDELD
jgi:hypothetical protein